MSKELKNSAQETTVQPTSSRRSFLLKAGGLTAALALGNGLWREPYSFVVEELTVPLAKIPPGREIRVVQLSDLHIRSFQNYHTRVVEAVHQLTPDLILLTGDYLEKQRNLKATLQFLDLLSAPKGVFAVQGNWEYWARIEGDNLKQKFAGRNIRLLLNERADLSFRDVPLSILGLDFPSGSNALKHLQSIADPRRINLLLSHVPAFRHEALNSRIDLILSGHTHGGQVRLPFLPPFHLPRYSGQFVSGLYEVGPGIPLYVNRGIGTSMLPIRFLCRPEITLLRLQARGSE